MPVLTAVQLEPLFDERKTPLPSAPVPTPAKRYVPFTATPRTILSVTLSAKPLLTALQLVPLSLERKTPSLRVPANRFVPLTAKTLTAWVAKPVLNRVQFVPLL